MHMSSSDVKPNTRFACTQFPVYVRPGCAGSVGGHSVGFGPSVVQSFAAPLGLESEPVRSTAWRTDSPGATPGCSSQPRRGCVALSCVHSYEMRWPAVMWIGGVKRRAL